MNRGFVVGCLVAFALGVGLTLGAIAVYPGKKTASSSTHNKRHSGGTRSISWTKAQQKLARCKVEAVEQEHSRLVTLTLRKGRKVSTHEPAFGDVVHELARVGNRCGKIKLSTL